MAINSQYGKPGFTAEDDSFDVELFAHIDPKPWTEYFPVAASQTLAANTVVGLSGGNLVIANTSTVKPCGILVHGITTGAGQTAQGAIYRAGHFNKAALVWDATFSTDALKLAAFRDEAIMAGTTILVS